MDSQTKDRQLQASSFCRNLLVSNELRFLIALQLMLKIASGRWVRHCGFTDHTYTGGLSPGLPWAQDTVLSLAPPSLLTPPAGAVSARKLWRRSCSLAVSVSSLVFIPSSPLLTNEVRPRNTGFSSHYFCLPSGFHFITATLSPFHFIQFSCLPRGDCIE